jgi:predicted nucleotidyltransferase
MVEGSIIAKIKKDFSFIKTNPHILGLFLYGSYAHDYADETSDIDLCFVVPKYDLYEIWSFIIEELKGKQSQYDIRFFEELPLEIQGEVMDLDILIYSPNEPELYEYLFFKARKDWEDWKYKLKFILN